MRQDGSSCCNPSAATMMEALEGKQAEGSSHKKVLAGRKKAWAARPAEERCHSSVLARLEAALAVNQAAGSCCNPNAARSSDDANRVASPVLVVLTCGHVQKDSLVRQTVVTGQAKGTGLATGLLSSPQTRRIPSSP